MQVGGGLRVVTITECRKSYMPPAKPFRGRWKSNLISHGANWMLRYYGLVNEADAVHLNRTLKKRINLIPHLQMNPDFPVSSTIQKALAQS